MFSRWNMTEQALDNRDLLQVEYAFLELPKLPADKPEGGAAWWAWLFVHAPELSVIPESLEAGSYGEALELANKATFSQDELDAYQRVRDEIGQVRELIDAKWAEGKARGRAESKAEGRIEGEAKGKAEAILTVLAARGLPVSAETRARIEACSNLEVLDRWIARAVTAASVSEVLGLP